MVGVAPLSYQETRYTFFFYPLIICIAGYAINGIGGEVEKRHRSLCALVPASFVVLFLISSDFAIEHLTKIDSYDANFRVGYSNHRARHYYSRSDFRSAAAYVNGTAGDSDKVIITSVVVANYLDQPGQIYLDRTDGRYRGQACSNEQLERWTGLPLLSSVSELTATIRAGKPQTSWIIVDQQISQTPRWAKFLRTNPEAKEVYRTPDKRIAVYVYPDLPPKFRLPASGV